MAKRKQGYDEFYEWAKDVDILDRQGDPWAMFKYRYVCAVEHGNIEERDTVKAEIVEITRRILLGMSTADAFALMPIPKKPEPMPRDFSTEDRFRARGMGIRLD